MSAHLSHAYIAMRRASHGAGISLLLGCGELTAHADCAAKVAQLLGTRWLDGDKLRIPMDEAQKCLVTLTARHSVALLDVMATADAVQFVCVWVIRATGSGEVVQPETISTNPDDY